MWGLFKFLFLCAVATAAGIAAVSIPVGDRTPAEHLRALFEEGEAAPAPAPAATEKRVMRERRRQAAARPPAEEPTQEDRAALERLIGEKVR